MEAYVQITLNKARFKPSCVLKCFHSMDWMKPLCVYTLVSWGTKDSVCITSAVFCFFSYGLGTVSGRVRACHGTYNRGVSVSERVRAVPGIVLQKIMKCTLNLCDVAVVSASNLDPASCCCHGSWEREAHSCEREGWEGEN